MATGQEAGGVQAAEAGGGCGASLSRWRDTCAALGAGTVEEPATSPPGVGTAGKARGFRGRVLRAGRGSGEGFRDIQRLQNATKYGPYATSGRTGAFFPHSIYLLISCLIDSALTPTNS